MTTPPPAALLAFLRGLERRAHTLAEAQCGDAGLAERVWRDTAAAFPAEAAVLPVATWPVRFWARLLAHPDLAAPRADGSPLADVGPGPRAALLLRLVAGLDPRPAAEVLGVSESTYRYALQRGLEQARAAGIDADALKALRESWQRQPAPRTPGPAAFVPAPAVAEAPPHALEPTRSTAPPVHSVERAPWRGRRWVLATAAALALVAVGWWVTQPAPPPAPATRPVAAMPAPIGEPAPPSPVTHPDYLIVAEPDDARLVDDIALLSWLAAGAVAPPAPTDGAATP